MRLKTSNQSALLQRSYVLLKCFYNIDSWSFGHRFFTRIVQTCFAKIRPYTRIKKLHIRKVLCKRPLVTQAGSQVQQQTFIGRLHLLIFYQVNVKDGEEGVTGQLTTTDSRKLKADQEKIGGGRLLKSALFHTKLCLSFLPPTSSSSSASGQQRQTIFH